MCPPQNTSLGFLILDAFLYVVLAWYLDNVLPSEWGSPLPWNFPFTRAYWVSFFGIYEVEESEDDTDISASAQDPHSVVEAVPVELESRPGIKIRRLRREFPGQTPDKPHVAVHSLTMDIYQGQIFVLLGHNGICTCCGGCGSEPIVSLVCVVIFVV
jgi:hypothetical protein